MAAAFDRMGKFSQAEVHYQQAMKLAPHDARNWNDLGYSYYLQNRWPDAERTLKTADAMKPNDSRTLTNLGLTLAAQGKEADALTALSRANGPAVGHANLGFILAAMGKTDEARRHYETALSIQPNLEAARVAIAKLGAASAPAGLASAAPVAPIAASKPGTSRVAVTPASHPPSARPAPLAVKRPVRTDAQVTRTSNVSGNDTRALPTLAAPSPVLPAR
jgi:Flp pilus assembly protein TadD